MNINMKAKVKYLLLYLVFFPAGIFTFSSIPNSSLFNGPNPLTSDYGVSCYNITQSVTYDVEINFTLTHHSGAGNYFFKFARINNRVPNSTFTQFTPPYQKSMLLYNNISGYNPTEIKIGHNDRFNNTYDSFNASLLSSEAVSLDQKYQVELNAVKFQNIDDTDIGTYDMSNEIFDLYCNHSESYYERDDPSLISLSNSIVNPSDNPIEKAKKIYDWVSNHLSYNGNLPAQEKGALWAYQNLEGDCSEFSSLMITLLRIQNIPARKVTGFLVSNNPSLRPSVGKTWNFYSSNLGTNMLGHAWVEYFVPEIGWIACDPTWNSDYFNKIDYLRFNLNVGANFFLPPSYIVSEFSNPMFVYGVGASFDFNYNVKITVIASNLAPIGNFPILFIVFIGIGVAAVFITIIIIIKRSRKKKISYN